MSTPKERAAELINAAGIWENGYGYMLAPISKDIRKEISERYFSPFVVETTTKLGTARKVVFLVSKKFKGKVLHVDKRHLGPLIGPKGKTIKALQKKLDRIIRVKPTKETKKITVSLSKLDTI